MDEVVVSGQDTVKPVQSTEETTKEPVLDINVLAAQLEQIKKAQAGSDKAYQEASKKAADLLAENEKLKKEKMTEKELAAFETAKQKTELEQKSKEVAEAILRLSKMKLMGEKNVPIDLADFIAGNTEQELSANIEALTKHIDTEVGKRLEAKLSGAETPRAGAGAGQQATVKVDKMSFREVENLARENKL